MSEASVERAISKSKPLFALLMVESNTSEVVKPLNSLTLSLLREFENVFPQDLPSRLPHLDELSIKLTFNRVLFCLTRRLIGVTLISRRSYNDKSKSYLIVGTLGRV